MATKLDETRRIQVQENPGHMPDRKSYAKDAHTRPMHAVIERRKKRATDILARWSSEDDE